MKATPLKPLKRVNDACDAALGWVADSLLAPLSVLGLLVALVAAGWLLLEALSR